MTLDVVAQPLAEADHYRLSAYEQIIERGLQTFYEVGEALAAIRDERLYREKFDTFEDYCRERWNLSSSRARRLIYAAGVMENLSGSVPIGTLPENEAQARPLAPLRDDPDALRETWERAHEIAEDRGERFTAGHVAEAVDERVAERQPHAVHFSSATPEWYTPAHIVERVVEALGAIDLDPCSNAKGDAANVPAGAHYTAADDGLNMSWVGRVYMNPPYGDQIGAWVEKLMRDYERGSVTEAVALLPGRIDTAWFRKLSDQLWCCLHGRLKFVGASGSGDSAPFPSVLVYFGDSPWRFIDAFADIGTFYQRVSTVV